MRSELVKQQPQKKSAFKPTHVSSTFRKSHISWEVQAILIPLLLQPNTKQEKKLIQVNFKSTGIQNQTFSSLVISRAWLLQSRCFPPQLIHHMDSLQKVRKLHVQAYSNKTVKVIKPGVCLELQRVAIDLNNQKTIPRQLILQARNVAVTPKSLQGEYTGVLSQPSRVENYGEYWFTRRSSVQFQVSACFGSLPLHICVTYTNKLIVRWPTCKYHDYHVGELH